ncbi:MAG: hypothetical protein HYV27_01770 [Candidatus Hydrogenedentes bacterium]|nr:hypothetical protein [Candidatus Hydrogenedentota bacterium]
MSQRTSPGSGSLVFRCAAAMVIAAGLSLLFVLRLEDRFRCTVQLVVTPTPFEVMQGIEGQTLSGNGSRGRDGLAALRVLETLALPEDARIAMNASPQRAHRTRLSMPDFALLFQGSDVVQSLRTALQEKYPETRPTLERVASAMNTRARIALQTPDDAVYQEVLELSYTASTPEAAAFAANTWASLCLAAADAIHESRMAGTRQFVEERKAALQTAWDENQKNLERFRSTFDVAANEARLTALEQQVTETDLALVERQRDEKVVGAELAALHYAGGTAQPRRRTTSYPPQEEEAPVDTPVTGPDWKEKLSVERRLHLAGIKEELVQLDVSRKSLRTDADALRVQLAHAKTDRDGLERVEGTLRRSLDALEGVESMMGASGPAFTQAALAPAPESAAGPHRARIVAGVTAIAGVAAVLLTLLQRALQGPARRTEAPAMAQHD